MIETSHVEPLEPDRAPSERWRRDGDARVKRTPRGPRWLGLASAHAARWLDPARRAGLIAQRADEPADPADQDVLAGVWARRPRPRRQRERQEKPDAPRDLAPQLRSFIGRLIGRSVEPVRMHVGPQADRVARQHDADAVTSGPDVFFRAGRFEPATPRGLALIGHELTHVAQLRDARDRTPRSERIMEHRETEALRIERTLLMPGPAVNRPAPVAPPRSAPRPSAAPPAQAPVLTAARSRDLGDAPAAPVFGERELAALKDAVYRDLRDRLRIEFERGA